MSQNEDRKEAVIPVELIHETFMPPYKYQTPQNGFGSTGVEHSQDLDQSSKKSVAKVEAKNEPKKLK